LTDKPRCKRCGWILTPSQQAVEKPPRFDIPDVALTVGGLILGPVGVLAGMILAMSSRQYWKNKAKVMVAWGFIGCCIYLILYMFVPPARNLMVNLYNKLAILKGS